MPEVYVIVADASLAKILHASDKAGSLLEQDVLTHPEGRQHTRDLTSDLPGHDSNHVGAGRHGLDSPTDPKSHELENFAREIAAYLDELVMKNVVDQLMLVAPPVLLGQLRGKLSSKVKSVVSHELVKNLTRHSEAELRAQLPWFKPVERQMT